MTIVTAEDRIIVRSRAGRVVAVVWVLAGLLFLVGAGLLIISQKRVSFDLPSGIVAIGVGVWLWRRRVEFDRDGLLVVAGRRQRRLLWPRVLGVGIVAGPWWRTAVGVETSAGTIPLAPTWGTSRATRVELREQLAPMLADHGISIAWHE